MGMIAGDNIWVPPRFVATQSAIVCLVVSMSGCVVHDNDDISYTSSAAVSSSAAASSTGYSCPGVPNESVEALFGRSVEYVSNPIVEDGVLDKMTCNVKVNYGSESYSGSGLKVNYTHYRKGIDPWWDGYRASYAGRFSVVGDDGFGELKLADDGGTALYNCGDRYHYVMVSVLPRSGMRGDLRTNLIGLASSMIPWVCQEEQIPGLGIPMDTAPPNPTGAPTPPSDGLPSEPASAKGAGRRPSTGGQTS